MRKLLAGIGALTVSTTMMSHAQSQEVIPVGDNETSQLWFVELSSQPSIDGTAISALEREEATFHAGAAGAGIRYAEGRHFRELFNGLTVRATATDVNKLRALPGVLSVYPDITISVGLPEDRSGEVSELITALKQTGADIAQSELGLSGRGVLVAVIDTGVDYDHPDLGGCFGPHCRVEKGFDLVGDAFDANDIAPIIAPDPDPDDCAGHGTHVAGIIGANGGIKGVAPEVTFLAYRVFGCAGTTNSEMLLDAMERAQRDHADVINISIGAALQWPQYPTARAADRLVKHGIVVVAAAGNEGALGLYGSAAPSLGKNVIAVASFDNTNTNAAWTNQVASEPNPTANLISSFSSYGPAPDLSFKPDIGAPGGTIRSTLPFLQGSYGNLSGTSMSSAHVAGAVALLLESTPHASPEEVQQRLQNSARPHLWSGDPGLGFLDFVHRQGAGMLRIDDAVEADAVVSPSSLALGEIESGAATRWLRIAEIESHDHHGHNADDDAVTYTLGHEPALSTGANTFEPQALASFATVQFGSPTVTLSGRRHGHGDNEQVRVTITPPLQSDGARVFGGYITFTPDDGGTVLRVPYTGYNGNYQAIQVFTLAGFPLLAKVAAGVFLAQPPSGALFTMSGDDVPFILFHLNHQVRSLKMEVVDVATGQSLNFADDEEFLGRNTEASSVFAFGWDGTTMKRTGGKQRIVPNGTYRIDLSILKALGDPRNPAHFERWSSPNITIARPTPAIP